MIMYPFGLFYDSSTNYVILGNEAMDKSEDSKSEDLDENSWADSDDLASSSDFKKVRRNYDFHT